MNIAKCNSLKAPINADVIGTNHHHEITMVMQLEKSTKSKLDFEFTGMENLPKNSKLKLRCSASCILDLQSTFSKISINYPYLC